MHWQLFAPPGDGTSLRVGLGGDIPIEPPFFMGLTVLGGYALSRYAGEWPFFPVKGKYALAARVATAAVIVGGVFKVAGLSRQALVDAGSGVAFTPVKGIATTGPFAYSRNPMYIILSLLPTAAAILTDNAWIIVSGTILPLYLDQVVIPREEAFIPTQVDAAAYAAYSARVPRWFSLF